MQLNSSEKECTEKTKEFDPDILRLNMAAACWSWYHFVMYLQKFEGQLPYVHIFDSRINVCVKFSVLQNYLTRQFCRESFF